MAVDITEYAQLARDGAGGTIPAGMEPAVVVQQIAESGISQQSAAFKGRTTVVRVHTDATIRVSFGENPSASGASMRMVANSTEFFGVRGGDKIAVIAAV